MRLALPPCRLPARSRSAGFLATLVAVLLIGCREKTQITTEFGVRDLTLPRGQVIKVETMTTTYELRRGMMFRTSLAPDHGMLFVHPTIGNYSYWMYETRIPLDIIWMDNDRRIIEMVHNAQPCKTPPQQCVQYYCSKPARYVLELAGGMAAKYGLERGEVLTW